MKSSLLRRCLAGLGAFLLVLAAGATPAAAHDRSAVSSGTPAPRLQSSASPQAVSGSSALPPTLASLVARGKLKIVSQFATQVPGLTGYIVRTADDTEVVYGEHGYLFVGHLISPQGADLTDGYRARYGPKPDYRAIVSKLDSGGHLIAEGRGTAPLLYVFIDPNCIFCYHFYKMAEPLVAAGRLQLRWVIVGFLQSTSLARATTILSAQDPRSALHADEDRFDTAHEAGGVAPASSQDEALQRVLKAHLAAMDAVGGNGTPTLLYRDEQGRWAAVVGLPSSDWLTAYAGRKPLPSDPNG
jgi:thiol:disulfide interchange protein DsbG